MSSIDVCPYKGEVNGSEAQCTLPMNHVCEHVYRSKGVNPLTMLQLLAWRQEIQIRVTNTLIEERSELVRVIQARR
jgi:hypothetical protein